MFGLGLLRRIAVLVALAAVVAAAACTSGGNGGQEPGTPTPVGSPSAAAASQGSAVYLSLGDSIQYGCCGDVGRSSGELFRQYLAQRLNRPVEWVTLADNGTAESFIRLGSGEPSQLDRAVALLGTLSEQGRPAVAITMCVGGNDFLFLTDPDTGRPCHERLASGCGPLFRATLERYKNQLDLILTTLNRAKDPSTPLLLLNYYNTWDYGEITDEYISAESGLVFINQAISEAAKKHGAFLVDIYPLFKGKAREYISGVDPSDAGHRLIAEAYQEVYESLPPDFVEPFALVPTSVAPTPSPTEAATCRPKVTATSTPAVATVEGT